MPVMHTQTAGKWRAGLLPAVLTVVAVFTTACGGGGKPNASGSSPGPGSASQAAAADAIKYSNCMRSHGVTNFPEPGTQNQPQNSGPINLSSPTYIAAETACRHLAPGGGATNPQASSQVIAQLVKLVACMRKHGVPNMPDPTSAGMLSLPSDGSVNPQSSAFQNAEKACQSLLPTQGVQP